MTWAWILGTVIPIVFAAWAIKTIYKRRLEHGLGREVKDHELTSITAWMDAERRDEIKADREKL